MKYKSSYYLLLEKLCMYVEKQCFHICIILISKNNHYIILLILQLLAMKASTVFSVFEF